MAYRQLPSILSHPMLPRIAKAIIDGESCRSIANWVRPPLSHVAIQRYANNSVTPSLVKASRLESILEPNMPMYRSKAVNPAVIQSVTENTVEALAAAPILSLFRQRLQQLAERTDRGLDKIEADDKHLPLMAGMLGQAHKNVELLGRATGELQEQQAPAVAIQIVMPSASPAPSSPAQGLIETIDISTVRR